MKVGDRYQTEVLNDNYEMVTQTFEVIEVRDGIVISQLVM